MIQLCGQFGFEVETAWRMTPGEFEGLATGWAARLREGRLLNARLEAVALKFGGVDVSPLVIIGEQDEFGPNPFGDDDDAEREEQNRLRLEHLDRRAARRHELWLPRGIVLGGGGEEDP